MRRRRGSLVLALVVIVACRTVPELQTEPQPVRVMVYNIHAGKDSAGADNLKRVAALIREHRADIVLLQEVDRGTERSGGVDQVATLERLTGLSGAFGKTLDYQGGEYGIATLSRWRILGDTLIDLPVTPVQTRAGGSTEPRGVLRAAIATPRGVLYVFNTHLDPSRDDSYRRQEIAQVLLYANRLIGGRDAVLLGGDMNSEPGSIVIDRVNQSALKDAWRVCRETSPGLTYPAGTPVKRIDYLFLSPTIRCDSVRVLDTRASDHRPVLVDVRALFYVETLQPIHPPPVRDSLPPR